MLYRIIIIIIIKFDYAVLLLQALMRYETPNPKHGQYEILLGDRDYVRKQTILSNLHDLYT